MSDELGYSNRQLIQTFAACLAHLLNAGHNGAVRLEPAEIFQRLTKLLTKRLPRTASGPYDGLTGLNVLVGRSAEEAAELFFERVLERRLFLAPATEFHKAHELFCRLCQRGMHASWTRC